MTPLSLDHINEHAPYYVMLSPRGSYIFETTRGIHYSISFEEDAPIGGCNTYQFIIEKIDKVRSSHDAKVEPTILAIIEEFFRANGGVLLYICATGDGMQKYRFHLFLRWFNTYEHRDLYEIRTVEDVMDDKTPNYGAIIVEKTHPDLELILARFDELAAFLKKPIV